MPNRPEQSASAVTALGTTARSGMPRRSRRGLLMHFPWSLRDALERLGLADFRDHRLPGDGALAEQNARRGAGGKIDVDPAAEADQADALAGGDKVARFHPGDDPARDHAGNLGEPDPRPACALDQEMLALIVLARLVEVGIEELAGDVDDTLDLAGDRG